MLLTWKAAFTTKHAAPAHHCRLCSAKVRGRAVCPHNLMLQTIRQDPTWQAIWTADSAGMHFTNANGMSACLHCEMGSGHLLAILAAISQHGEMAFMVLLQQSRNKQFRRLPQKRPADIDPAIAKAAMNMVHGAATAEQFVYRVCIPCLMTAGWTITCKQKPSSLSCMSVYQTCRGLGRDSCRRRLLISAAQSYSHQQSSHKPPSEFLPRGLVDSGHAT